MADGKKQKRGSAYDIIADKVGLVPNCREDDNLFQLRFIAIFTLLSVVVGGAWLGPEIGIVVGFLIGVVGGGILSGIILLVIGLLR